MKTIYDRLKSTGVELSSHESDLYAPVNEKTKPIIATYEFKKNVRTFISNIDGKLWYNIPFAYQPFWDKK